MTIYFVIFGILAALSYTDLFRIKNEQRSVLLCVVAFILIVFAGLRYGGPDYLPYKLIFQESQSWNLEASPDIGYSIFNYILGVIWNDPLIVFIAVAAISVSLNIKCYNEYGKYVFVAILFYFVHNYALKEMIQIRAGLACALGLYNIRNLQKGNYQKFWLLQLLAMSIHLGAVMYLIAWLLRQLNLSRRAWWFILTGCFIVGMVYPLGAVIKDLPGMELLERVQTYSQWDQYAKELGILTNMATLKQLVMCLTILIFYDKLKIQIVFFDIIAAMYLASTCWLMVLNDFAIVGARMATFLSIGEPIIWGTLLALTTPSSRKILLPLLLMFALLFLHTNMTPGKIVPYTFYPLF